MNMTCFKKITAALLAVTAMAGCGQATAAPATSTADSSAPASTSQSVSEAAPAGPKGIISVVSREDGSGTRGAFIELFGILEKGADGSKVDKTSQEATIVSKTDVMLQTIAGDPTSIGYVSLGSLNDSVKALKIYGSTPSAQTMLDGSYKISRPFNIATKGEPQGLAKDFLDFILSSDGQAVVEKSGYVAVDSSAAPYAGQQPSGKIVVGGSSSVYPVMEKLKEAYEANNPNATIELQSSDSTAGMTGAIDGIFDIGMASRDLKDSEKETLTGVAIAIDGIAVIVHPENTLENLSSASVKAIFTGELTDWSAAQ